MKKRERRERIKKSSAQMSWVRKATSYYFRRNFAVDKFLEGAIECGSFEEASCVTREW